MTSRSDQAGANDDARLAVEAAIGDTRAFGVLMRRHKDAIYRFCRRYVGDADDAYDLTQQTFVSAWSALGRYDPNRAFTTWLRAIALNKCRDHGRRATVRRLIFGTRPSTEAALTEIASDAPSAETQAQDTQVLRALDRALSILPDALKTPLILTALDGLSTAEAAAVMGVSPKAVETRLYRARKVLGGQLAKALADR
ncbi:MAG: RNA polymerase sigma factor [Brevundimonas sp.]|uniref:RNA polymerase sigma factor n=1 Tax=Brevundimonas sp. TaxID=1871086 RepID=UPI002734FEFE|nr:RNA polymerase sigma factor [Brevundimonas sp.]MDP3404449.1 RNA polymerase sigma factor [Brevundimonas sp.]